MFFQKYLLLRLYIMTTIIFGANVHQYSTGSRSLLLTKITAMRIILCLDCSSFTEKVLAAMQAILQSLKEYEISVIHVIDETLFSAGAGYEIQMNEDMKTDSTNLKKLSIQYLGEKVHYIEEYGIPRQKIDEILAETDYDILAIGSRSRSILGARLLGGVAEHLLRNSTKPVLVIQ